MPISCSDELDTEFNPALAAGPLTEPMTEAGLLRLSASLRNQSAAHGDEVTTAGVTRLSALGPSLLEDLLREPSPAHASVGLDVLEVMAAALRHGRALCLHLEEERRVIPLSVYPVEHLVYLPLTPVERDGLRLSRLRVLHVEPAPELPTQHRSRLWPLGLLLWELALRGARDALLPPIAAHAAYRIAPGANLDGLELGGSLAMAVSRLRREAHTLGHIARWPGFDTERAIRLLNGLYLQAALVVTRTHPAATNPDWVPRS